MLKYLWMKYEMIYLWTGLGGLTPSDWCGKRYNWSGLTVTWVPFFSCLLFYVFEIFHNKKLKGKAMMTIFRAPRERPIEWRLCRGRGSSCWLALDRASGGLFFSTGGGQSDGVFTGPCWSGRKRPWGKRRVAGAGPRERPQYSCLLPSLHPLFGAKPSSPSSTGDEDWCGQSPGLALRTWLQSLSIPEDQGQGFQGQVIKDSVEGSKSFGLCRPHVVSVAIIQLHHCSMKQP